MCPRGSIEAGVGAGGCRARKARLLARWGPWSSSLEVCVTAMLEESLGHLGAGNRLEVQLLGSLTSWRRGRCLALLAGSAGWVGEPLPPASLLHGQTEDRSPWMWLPRLPSPQGAQCPWVHH